MANDITLTQDTGIPGATVVQQYATDNSTVVLVAAATNTNGLQLWSIGASSIVQAATSVKGDDVVQDSSGTVYIALENGSNSSTVNTESLSMEMHGIVVPAGLALQIVTSNLSSPTTHRMSATVIYSMIAPPGGV